ncbi:hypothetical protein BHM03_00016545 [Ensete ventricosum]|nr:hypothetical protein BHM03_00016545 [Ensete ventricosum]
MQHFQISGYFHDFPKEQTMMLEVFPDDDLRFTAHDRKKEQEEGIHMTPTAMMPSTSVLALPDHGNVRLDYYYRATIWQPMQGRNFPLTNVEVEESMLRKIKFSFIASSTSAKFKPQGSGPPATLDLAKLGF